jgi:3-carboxy-cis,cis-muconate cycloisomerase
MPSTAIDSQIHGCMFSTDEMREILSDKAWVQKWLDTESSRDRGRDVRLHSG